MSAERVPKLKTNPSQRDVVRAYYGGDYFKYCDDVRLATAVKDKYNP